ncbi:MAG: hypothetical protein FJ149_05550 [Euryarchaeota archaeon]|nr:hypothetical protein [Euryarchaeota archaeon]
MLDGLKFILSIGLLINGYLLFAVCVHYLALFLDYQNNKKLHGEKTFGITEYMKPAFEAGTATMAFYIGLTVLKDVVAGNFIPELSVEGNMILGVFMLVPIGLSMYWIFWEIVIVRIINAETRLEQEKDVGTIINTSSKPNADKEIMKPPDPKAQ